MGVILEKSHRDFRMFISNVTGVQMILPVVVTDQGVLANFAKFMYLHRSKSRAWQDSMTFSVQMLLEYTEVNHEKFDIPSELFSEFANALFMGTVNGHIDPSGLYWQPRQIENANKIIGNITAFSDWISGVQEDNRLQLNPWREATKHEQRLNWAAHCHKRDNAFLSHLWRGKINVRKTRLVQSRGVAVERSTPTKAFAETHINKLIEDGFPRRSSVISCSTNLRDILIVYLMHYGGVRLSEALGIWNEDVTVEGGEVIVRIYHPQYGMASKEKTRADVLQRTYGLSARNTLVKAADPLFLGWKNSLITDPDRRCFEVFFFPHEASVTFANMWRDYHLIQKKTPAHSENHPYAFSNLKGQPYSHRMFRKAHKKAIGRIGMAYGKLYGTTPHGHRHAYGQRLAKNGAEPLLIKHALHHVSITSSQVYTEPSAADFRKSLIELEAVMLFQHDHKNVEPEYIADVDFPSTIGEIDGNY